MKKCYFILGLLISTPAIAVQESQYSNQIKEQINNFCLEIVKEEAVDEPIAEMKTFCKNVAACVVNGAPTTRSFNNPEFMQMATLICMKDEAKKLLNE